MSRYMDIEAFLNPVQAEETEVVISDRFKDSEGNPVPWVLKAAPIKEINKLRKKNTKTDKDGNVFVDTTQLNTEIAVASIVFPDLKDVRLQERYHTVGEVETLYAMLNDGECTELIKKALAVNGYGKSLNKTVKEVKNL